MPIVAGGLTTNLPAGILLVFQTARTIDYVSASSRKAVDRNRIQLVAPRKDVLDYEASGNFGRPGEDISRGTN